MSFLGVPDPREEGTLEHQALAQTRPHLGWTDTTVQGARLRGSRRNREGLGDSEQPNETMGPCGGRDCDKWAGDTVAPPVFCPVVSA